MSTPRVDRLLIVRHGKAEPALPGIDDAARALVDRGQRQARWLGRELARLGWAPPILRHSPIRRAAETARLIAAAAGVSTQPEDRLVTDAPPGPLVELIAGFRDQHPGATLALVGHNPTLEQLIAALAPRPRTGTAAPTLSRWPALATGACVVIEWPAPAPLDAGELAAWLRLDEPGD